MPGEAFNGSPWVTGAEITLLVLGSLGAAGVGAAVIAKKVATDGLGALGEGFDDNAPGTPKRARVKVSRASEATGGGIVGSSYGTQPKSSVSSSVDE